MVPKVRLLRGSALGAEALEASVARVLEPGFVPSKSEFTNRDKARLGVSVDLRQGFLDVGFEVRESHKFKFE